MGEFEVDLWGGPRDGARITLGAPDEVVRIHSVTLRGLTTKGEYRWDGQPDRGGRLRFVFQHA